MYRQTNSKICVLEAFFDVDLIRDCWMIIDMTERITLTPAPYVSIEHFAGPRLNALKRWPFKSMVRYSTRQNGKGWTHEPATYT